jgi:hypothetical protein
MNKHLAVICFFIMLIFTGSFAVNAKTIHSKSRRKKGHNSSRVYKTSKYSRKKRHHGSGPDLKSITKESPYTEEPTNGVNPVENKQPGI